MSRNPRQSWILDSTPWIPDSLLVDLDSGFQSLAGFRIPQANIFWIPESEFPYYGAKRALGDGN